MRARADRATVPVERFEFATGDVTQAHEMLRKTYADHEVVLRGSAENFRYRQQTADAGVLAVDRIRHTMRMAVSTGPLDYLSALVVVNGRLSVRAKRDETRLARNDVLLYRCGTPLSVDWDDLEVCRVRCLCRRPAG